MQQEVQKKFGTQSHNKQHNMILGKLLIPEEIDPVAGKYWLVTGGNYYNRSNDYGVNWYTDYALSGASQPRLSEDGQYQFMQRSVYPYPIFRSSNYGVSWAGVINTYSAVRRIEISGNAQYVIVGVNGDFLFVSSDYGVTFAQRLTYQNWDMCAVNYTGQYMAAAYFSGNLYTSNDYGQTWTEHTFATYFQSAKYSKTGQYLYVTTSSNETWRSDDYGANFSSNYIGGVDSIALSMSGQYVFLSNSTPKISNNYGVSYSNPVNAGTTHSSMSYDGKYLLSTRINTYYNLSSDYGASFVETYVFDSNLREAHISRNPKYMAMTEQTKNRIRISSNYGTSWNTKPITSPSQIRTNTWE
jgi:hypothetical protein